MYVLNDYGRDSVRGCGQRRYLWSQGMYWLAFAAISVLFHFIVLQWVNMPATAHSRYTDGTGVLTLSIDHTVPVQEDFGFEARPVSRQPDRITEQSKAPALNKPAVVRNATKLHAAELIEAAYKAIPDIVKTYEEDALLAKSNKIFDPRLRKKLEASRQEKERLKALGLLDRKQEFVEVTAYYGEYVGIRIGKKCWRVPVETDPDPFDTRIWTADTNCPKQKKAGLFRRSAYDVTSMGIH